MTSKDIIEFAKGIGAEAMLKNAAVCIYTGPREFGGIRGWSDAVFVHEETDGWSVGFSQHGRTRVLEAGELRDLLKAWVSGQDRAVFRAYEKA
jgi:hypothetical protein